MRIVLTLLMLMVALSASEAAAQEIRPVHDYTVTLAGARLGISDLDVSESIGERGMEVVTRLYFGPFGSKQVPFTATQGLVGFGVIALILIASLVAFVLRWKRRSNGRGSVSVTPPE